MKYMFVGRDQLDLCHIHASMYRVLPLERMMKTGTTIGWTLRPGRHFASRICKRVGSHFASPRP